MSFLSRLLRGSAGGRDFKEAVGWLLGEQLLAGLKQIAIYTAYGDKIDFRDWMQGHCEDLSTADCSADQAYWFDYIADTGDGQKATYCIAYLCHSDLFLPSAECLPDTAAAKSVSLTDGKYRLPRGDFLFVGGDAAYHIADLETLAERLQTPFNWAYDDCFGPAFDPEHVRRIYAIPANHDYYDWLDGFNRQFRKPVDLHHVPPSQTATGPQLQLKGFMPCQSATFLALKLPFDWWLWGLDSQNGKIDLRQAAFFRKLQAEEGKPSRLIFATPEPSTVFGRWATMNNEKKAMIETFGKLDLAPAFLQKLDGHLPETQCRLDISGDIHHYARHWGQGRTAEPASRSNYASVVAGGGGAFLHPSHTDAGEVRPNALYPAPFDSHRLMLRSLLAPLRVGLGGYVWLAGALAALVSYFAVTIPQSTWALFHLLPDTLRPCHGPDCGTSLLERIQSSLAETAALTAPLLFNRFTPDLIYASGLAIFLAFWKTRLGTLKERIDDPESQWRKAVLGFVGPALLAGLPIVPFIYASSEVEAPSFLASAIVVCYVAASGLSFAIARGYADLTVSRAKRTGSTVPLNGNPRSWFRRLAAGLMGFGISRPFALFGLISFTVGLWRYGNHDLAIMAVDITALLVWLLLVAGLTAFAGIYGSQLVKDRGDKLRFWGIGIWHAVVQIGVPVALTLYGSISQIVVFTAFVVAVTYALGRIGFRVQDKTSILGDPRRASVWLALVWLALALPGLTIGVWGTPIEMGGGRLLIAIFLGAIFSCTWFGWYLAITVAMNGHNNEAGGGSRSECFRHLIRFKLTAKELTGYVIGIDNPDDHVDLDQNGRFKTDTPLRLVDVFTVSNTR